MVIKNTEITASGMKRRTARGRKRAEETRRTKLQLEDEYREAVSRQARKTANGREYRECRAVIREAADRGETSTTYRVSSGWSSYNNSDDGLRVRIILEELKKRLVKAGFEVSMSWPQEEDGDMGDSAAPCFVSQYVGRLDISWNR